MKNRKKQNYIFFNDDTDYNQAMSPFNFSTNTSCTFFYAFLFCMI